MLRRIMVGVVAMMLITVALVVAVEGISSVALATYNALKPVHTMPIPAIRFDRNLGWNSAPNAYVPDAYGKGIYVRTNSRGFRSNQEFADNPPLGKVRLVCTGDSFTFGFGVTNDEAWCQQLVNLDARRETVNMGENAYGIDQAYLRYLRDAPTIRHDALVFAFIAPDMARMTVSEFGGYAKPVLRIREGHLAVENTPVPEGPFRKRLNAFNDLGSVQLFRKVGERFGISDAGQEARAEAEGRAVTIKIFEELQALQQHENRLLVLLYLPWMEDYPPDSLNDGRREFFRQESIRRGLFYVDLTDHLRELSQRDAEDLFLRVPTSSRPNNTLKLGHYNTQGNLFMASELYERLKANPDFARRMEQADQTFAARRNQ